MADMNKSRYWAFILWIDSTPDLANDQGEWRIRLESLHIPMVVSPLHDRDIDQTGEADVPKKAHRHVMLQYGNVTTKKHVYNMITGPQLEYDPDSQTYKSTGCLGFSTQSVQAIVSSRGYFRYLTHMDNPEKAQYDSNRVITIAGFDVDSMMTDQDIENEVRRISMIMIQKKIWSYRKFYYYLIKNGMFHESSIVQHNTMHFRGLCAKEEKWEDSLDDRIDSGTA